MRNRLQLVVTAVLLAAQATTSFPGMVAASATSSQTAGLPQLEVSINTNKANPIVVTGPKQPNFDTDVLVPLRAKQAAEAQAAQVAAQAAAQAAAKAAQKAALARQKATATVQTSSAVLIPGSHTDWMSAAGIAASDFGYVDYIVSHESGWGVTKSNYSGSGAYGLGQAEPAVKMAVYGADYLTDPVTQLKWANAYAVGKYGSWANAYSHWVSHHSW
jgi:hypothetical protein